MSDSHPVSETEDPQARARAIQSLLIEKNITTTDAVDRIVRTYEEEIGPMNGAEVVAKAWTDSEYKQRLLDDATAAVDELGHTGLESSEIGVYENTASVHNVIVCTLCSCFPWQLLGLPPTWYKSPPYRAKMVKHPRKTLREEFDLDIKTDVEINVWDTSAEVRYMILPQPPEGAERLSEAELAQLVTRDAMIGIERLGDKHIHDFR
jgi:nitrile hydratase